MVHFLIEFRGPFDLGNCFRAHYNYDRGVVDPPGGVCVYATSRFLIAMIFIFTLLDKVKV